MPESVERTRRHGRNGAIALVFVLAQSGMVVLGSAARGQEEGSHTAIAAPMGAAVQTKDVSSNGDFHYGIAFDVPPFFGLTPGLGLSYASSGPRFGSASVLSGPGWSLEGFSEVRLTSANRGLPGAADEYQIDGARLVPCAQLSGSPGCAAGGTHGALFEDFRRYKFDGTTWTVTDKDGTQSAYAAMPGDELDRWLLTSRTDTHGNRVTYGYQVVSGIAYPATVSLGPYVVQYTFATRPDAFTLATGISIRTLERRLSTVRVSRAAELIRTYELSYTGEYLTAVSLRGMLGGLYWTERFHYPGPASGSSDLGFRSSSTDSSDLGTHILDYLPHADPGLVIFDYDNDGADELLLDNSPPQKQPGKGARPVQFGTPGTAMQVLTKSEPDGYWARYAGASLALQQSYAGQWVRPADLNGDGRHEIVRTGIFRDLMSVQGLSFSYGSLGTGAQNGVQYIADFNGDGRDDVMAFARYIINGAPGAGKTLGSTRTIHLSTGSRYVSGGSVTISNVEFDDPETIGDFNGDGAADLLNYDRSEGTFKVWLYNGRSMTYDTWGEAALSGGEHEPSKVPAIYPADVDGDGRTDLILYTPRDGFGETVIGRTRIYLSTGQSFSLEETYDNIMPLGTGDLNGDGCTDLVFRYIHDNREQVRRLTSSCPDPRDRMMSSVTTRLGGTITVTYGSSEDFTMEEGLRLPVRFYPVVQLTQNDGRGHAYTEDYSYASGKWDYEHRRFLGYRTRTKIMPASPGYAGRGRIVTTYSQREASAGRVDSVEYRNHLGSALKRVDYAYVERSVPPYRADRTREDTTTYLIAGAEHTRTDYHYDQYGNPTQVIEQRDLDTTADDTITITAYAQNQNRYMVSLPRMIDVRAGTRSDSPLLSRVRYAYDQDITDTTPSYAAAPTTGNRTHVAVWDDLDQLSSLRLTERVSYDEAGNVLERLDALGQRTRYTYTADKLFRARTIDPLGQLTRTVYDPSCAKLATVYDVAGRRTRTWFDEHCRPRETQTPTGDSVVTEHVNYGDPTSYFVETTRPTSSSGAPRQAYKFIDGLGRVYQTSSPNAYRTLAGFDTVLTEHTAFGTVYRQSMPFRGSMAVEYTTHHYDALGRLTETEHADGSRVTQLYRRGSALEATLTTVTTDERGNVEHQSTNALGKVVHRARAHPEGPVVTRYAYDRLGRLLSVTDPLGNVFSYEYNALGSRTLTEDPEAGISMAEYDELERLTASTDPLGNVTELFYDPLGRVVDEAVSNSNGQIVERVSRTYDLNLLMSEEVSSLSGTTVTSWSSIDYGYDADGQLVSKTWTVDGRSPTVRYGRYPDGNIKWIAYPDGTQVGSDTDPWIYEGGDRVVKIPGLITEIRYSPGGLTASARYFNGTTSTYGYDGKRGWLRSALHQNASGTLYRLGYVRNAEGLIEGIDSSDARRRFSYQYDSLDRLVSSVHEGPEALTESWTYDAGDRILSSSRLGSYSYIDTRHRPHWVGDGETRKVLLYDEAGNRTGVNIGTTATQRITYDARNRPETITTGTDTIRLFYGPSGERIRKRTSHGNHYYFGPDLELRPGVGYVKYPHPSVRWAGPSASGKTVMLRDHLDSVSAILDADGNMVSESIYRAQGAPVTYGADDESKGFIGERYDRESGLSYLNARYYDPDLGLFTQPDWLDPTKPGIGTNRYIYSSHDPINRSDRNGNQSKDEREERLEAAAASGEVTDGSAGAETMQWDRSPVGKDQAEQARRIMLIESRLGVRSEDSKITPTAGRGALSGKFGELYFTYSVGPHSGFGTSGVTINMPIGTPFKFDMIVTMSGSFRGANIWSYDAPIRGSVALRSSQQIRNPPTSGQLSSAIRRFVPDGFSVRDTGPSSVTISRSAAGNGGPVPGYTGALSLRVDHARGRIVFETNRDFLYDLGRSFPVRGF